MAAEYSLIFAACRDLGHAWMIRSWANGKRERLCACGTTRLEEISEKTGWKPTKRKYKYPKGYLLPGMDSTRVEKAIDARRRLVRLAQSQHVRWVEHEVRRALRTA